MITPDRFTRLQEVADYRTVRKTLRGGAIGSIIFGALAVFAGLLAPIDPVLTAVGAVLVGTGLWNAFSPRPTGIIVDGVSLWVVGLYNIGSVVMSASQGDTSGAGLWVKLGVFQLIWGGQSFVRFVRFRNAFKSPATGAELLELDEMATGVWKAKVKDTQDTIEFVTTGFGPVKWKARLDPDCALLVTGRGAEVRLVRREALDVEDTGKAMFSRTRKVKVQAGPHTWKGTMSPESLRRFQQWKTGVTLPEALAA